MSNDIMWHVIEPGQTLGLKSEEALRRGITEGTITPAAMVWRPGMDAWQAAGEVAGLFVPPALPGTAVGETTAGAPDPAISGPAPLPGAVQSIEGAESGGQKAIGHPRPRRWYNRNPKDSGHTRAGLAGGGAQDQKQYPDSEGNRGYLMRHWRGELPLGVSYWVSGILVALLAMILTAVVSAPDITKAPRLISSSYAILALILILASVWLSVGNWHSAGRRIGERHMQGKRAFWAYLVRVATVIQFFFLGVNTLAYSLPNITANLKIAFGGDTLPHHVLRLLNGGTEIALTGGFDFGTASDLRTLLSASPVVKTIDFNSIGGRVAEAEHVRELIRERGLATYTAGLCASACTLAFIGGNPRLVGPGGKLGFHRYSFPGLTPAQEIAANLAGQKSLLDAGINPEFVAKAFSTPGSGMWYPDMPTLRSANVIAQVVDGMSFSSAANGAVTAEGVEKILSATPGFAALKRAGPAVYIEAYESVVAGGRQGASVRQTWSKAQSLLRAAVMRYRAVASDEIQFQIAALMADEGQYLATSHPDACLMLFGKIPPAGSGYNAFLSQELNKRDVALAGAIIDGGSTAPADVVATDESALAELAPLWIRVKNEGFDLAIVGQVPQSFAEQRYNCLALSALMRNMSRLPVLKAGPLMRHLSNVAPKASATAPVSPGR
jgi:hypothetical protein